MCFYILYVCIWFRHPSDGTNHTFDKPEYLRQFRIWSINSSVEWRAVGRGVWGLGIMAYGLGLGVVA